MTPDYQGGSIVNLMASLIQARGGPGLGYSALRDLDPAGLREHRHIVLLVIDGLGYDYLQQASPGDTLRAYLESAITSVFPSTTATAITTFLTGLAPQQHGLSGWHTWFRELGSVITVLPARARFGGATLGDAGIDLGRLYGHVPVFDLLANASCLVAPAHIAHSDFNVAHRGRAQQRVYDSLDELVQLTIRAVREAPAPGYVYAYWPELDRLAHEHGIGSTQAEEHLSELDAAFTVLIEGLAGTDTVLVVTADHGIIDSGEAYAIDLADHPALADTLTLPLCGERRASYCYVRPDRRADFEHYCRTELTPYAELRPSAELIEHGWFGLGTPHPRLAERVGDYTLLMKENYVIKDWLVGEPRYTQVGVHGGISAQEMRVPLILARC